MNRKVIVGFLCMSILVCGLTGQTVKEAPLLYNHPRLMALGGYHAALTDDVLTIFNNPGGFYTAEPEFLLSELTLGITGPVFDIADSLITLEDMQGIATVLKGLNAGLTLAGPFSLAYAGQGISFGMFNWLDIGMEPEGALNLDLLVTDNLLLTGGYCFRIPIQNMTLDIGMQLKALMRGHIISRNSYLDLYNLLKEPFGLIMDREFTLSLGGGLDLGMLFTTGELFSFGLVARNLYMPTYRNTYASLNGFLTAGASTSAGGIIPLDLSAGIRVSPPLGFIERYVTDVQVLLDYGDILDFLTHPNTAKHWLLHLSLALEMKVLEKLSLRGGMAQGLPCAGLGLDLNVLRVNASMFGSELSLYPGMRPAYNFVIGFEVKL